MNFIEDLKWRGALNQVTDEAGLLEAMINDKIGAYVGTDPTAPSLHLGHLIPFMVLKRFQNAGGKAVIIIGGGTGAIGDPRPTTERKLLSPEQLAANEQGITAQVTKLFGAGDTQIVNNNDWLGKLTLTDFLRDYGKLFSINVMLKKMSLLHVWKRVFHLLNLPTKFCKVLIFMNCGVDTTFNCKLVVQISGAISRPGLI